MTLNEIVEIIRDLAKKHKKIEGFYTGLRSQHNDSVIQYPALRMSFPYKIRTFVSNSEDNDKISYEFILTLMVNEVEVTTSPTNAYRVNTNYQVQQNTLNEIDQPLVDENLLREEALEIMMQYVEGLRILESSYDYFVVNSYSIKSLERYANDFVTGVECTISITTDNNYKCESQANVLNEVWKEDSYFGIDPHVAQTDCPPFPTDCQTILDNLTTNILNDCILKTYDFSNSVVQSALIPQQVQDIEDWILPSGCSEILTFIEPYLTGCVIPSVDYSIPENQNALDPQQIDDLKDVVVPALDYTIGDNTDFNRFSPTQIDDLETRLIPQPTQYSMSFDGVNERIIGQTGGVFNFEKTNSFTFAFKIKPTVSGITRWLYSKYINAFPYKGHGLGYNSDGSIRFFMICGTTVNGQFINVRTVANVLQFGVWNHIVLTYDGTLFSSGVKLYVNGVLIPWTIITNDGVNLGGSILSTNNLEIGSASTDGLWYSGLMKDVRIWNTALTLANVATEYSNMSNYTEQPVLIGNLVGWCTMGTDDDAVWGLDTWAFENLIAGTTNFKGINMEFADRVTDIP